MSDFPARRSRSGDLAFVAEANLARLTRWLRAAGLDVEAAPAGMDGRRLSEWAASRQRIVLTRDRSFPERPARYAVIVSSDLDNQMAEVAGRFRIEPFPPAPLSRCMECNTPLEQAGAQYEKDLPPLVAERRPALMRCPSCGRIYWEGTHTRSILERLRSVRSSKAEPPVPASLDCRHVVELRGFLEALGFSWRGFRKKRRWVRRRLYGRLAELGLPDLSTYGRYLEDHPEEERTLHRLLGVTVSRFFRDREDWFALTDHVLAGWARKVREHPVRAWSLGCASGEEPYTLAMLWDSLEERKSRITILATEIRPELIERARAGLYPHSAIHHVPEAFRHYFSPSEEAIAIDPRIKEQVRFLEHDYLIDAWPRNMHLLVARNVIFTYRGAQEAEQWTARIEESLAPGGVLFLGSHDTIPRVLDERLERIGRRLWRKRS